MAAQISIEVAIEDNPEAGQSLYGVTVREGSGTTEHKVTVEKAYRDELAGREISTEELVRKSFEFLLDREPKESILRSFNLRLISRYFPEYEKEIRRALGGENQKT